MLSFVRPERLLLIGAVCVSGCIQVGPDFHPQREAWIEHWSSPAIEQVTSQGVQPDARQWWQVFSDQNLERLIAEADARNGGLKIAGLRVMEARAQLGIALSGRYPQVQQINGDVLYGDERRSGGSRPHDGGFLQYSAGFSVGWELDFWGRFSRAIESADSAYFAARANHDDVLVPLHAQVATTYYALRMAEARLRIARDNAKLQKRSYEITQRLFKSGESDELDLQQAKTQYLGTLATIPDFENQIMLARHALSILIGRPPGPLPELEEHPGKEGMIPLVGSAVLQNVPADLLLRRPDVSCRRTAGGSAQSALIGVAGADLYPL